MLKTIRPLFLSLFFLPIQAMELSENEAELTEIAIDDGKKVDDRTLSVGELEDFLFNFYRAIISNDLYIPKSPYDGKAFWKTCGWTALVSVPICLICGIGSSIVGCIPKNGQCRFGDCPPGIDPNDSSWVNSNACLSGIVFLSATPIFPFIVSLGITPLIWALNKYTIHKNNLLRRDLHENFTHGRTASELAVDEDIRKVAIALMESESPLLKKLNVDQSLILAQENFALFEPLINKNLFPQADLWAHKLSILFRANTEELEMLFGDDRIGEFFIEADRMWETVVRILPKDNLNLAIKSRLGAILVALKGELADKEIVWDSVIDEVKANKPINDIIARIVIAYENNQGKLITLHTKKGDLRLNRERLKEISQFFATSLSGNWHNVDEQNLLDVEEDLINVLMCFAKKEELDLRKDIITIIAAATYFGITELTKKCDALIASEGAIYNGSSNNLLLKAMNRKKKHPPKIRTQWKFFKTNGLVLNQAKLASAFLNNFASTLDVDIKVFGNYVNKVSDSLDQKSFIKRLENPETLNFAWKHFSKITLLRKIMLEFCASHEAIREKAWVLIPLDLDEEIKEFLNDG